jgi:hypothetical protein
MVMLVLRTGEAEFGVRDIPDFTEGFIANLRVFEIV